MKQSINKIIYLLRCKSGESLMESIAATLVFVILVAAVTTMIMTALRMTQVSVNDAKISRDAANAVLAHDTAAGSGVEYEPGNITFEFDASGKIELDVNIFTHNETGFTSFAYKP